VKTNRTKIDGPKPGLYPVASVLIVERRRCQCCKLVFETPSKVIHQLHTSHVNADFEQEIPQLSFPPPSDGVALRTTRFVEVTIAYCQYCWRDNIAWSDAAAIRPKAPKPATFNGPLPDLRVRPGIIPATIEELM
jgi:hypothetical protein